MRLAALSLLLLCAGIAPRAQAADAVVIYRCTDPNGHLTVGDSPCRRNQAQQTRTMVRPKDPAIARTLGVRSHAPSHSGEPMYRSGEMPAVRTLVIRPPRPMYECTTPDGDTYTSENAEGNPRWMPYWTLGYPVIGRLHDGVATVGNGMTVAGIGNNSVSTGSLAVSGIDHGVVAGGTLDSSTTGTTSGFDTDLRFRSRHLRVDAQSRNVGTWRDDNALYGGAMYGGGTWVRDDCYALPQQETCARLSDRRDAINRRFFNAMPSERDALNLEERGINAQLANDCGAD